MHILVADGRAVGFLERCGFGGPARRRRCGSMSGVSIEAACPARMDRPHLPIFTVRPFTSFRLIVPIPESGRSLPVIEGTTMATGIRRAGDFCWINILTPEPAEAMEFFAKVLGWTYFEMPGIGHGMQVDGRNIGGLFDLHGPNCPPESAMYRRDGQGRRCRRDLRAGRRPRRPIKQTCDIGDQGRMAVCHDPNGAQFRHLGAQEDAGHRRR